MTATSKIDIINKNRPEKIVKLIIKSPPDMFGLFYQSIEYKKIPNYIVKSGDTVGIISKHQRENSSFFTVITKTDEILLMEENDLIGTELFNTTHELITRTIQKKFTDYIYFDLGI